MKLSIICYGLSPAAVDLFTEMDAAQDVDLTVYPLFSDAISDDSGKIPFSYVPCGRRGTFIHVSGQRGRIPETLPVVFPLWTMWRAMRSADVILIVGMLSGATIAGALLRKFLGVPVMLAALFMAPDSEATRTGWIRRLKAFALKNMTHIIAQSRATAATLNSVYGIENYSLAPFTAGARRIVELKALSRVGMREMTRSTWGIGDDVTAYLFVGTLHDVKGLDVLLHAFKQVTDTNGQVALVIAGDDFQVPGYQTQLQSLAADLGISERVQFLGRVPMSDLVSVYAAADVFVLPSRKETWGKVVAEAGVFSIPVILTDACGSAGELVIDGINGIVVPPDNAEALAEAIDQLTDPSLRDSFRQSWAAIIQPYLDTATEAQALIAAVKEHSKS